MRFFLFLVRRRARVLIMFRVQRAEVQQLEGKLEELKAGKGQGQGERLVAWEGCARIRRCKGLDSVLLGWFPK
jgi:hypothetical protein